MKCSTVPDGPEVSATGAEVLVVLGRRAKLGCSVTGFPAPTVTWYKDGQGRSIVQIRSREKDYFFGSLLPQPFHCFLPELRGGRYQVEVVQSGEDRDQMTAFLEVETVSHLDWGVYTCQAINQVGKNEAGVVLKGKMMMMIGLTI